LALFCAADEAQPSPWRRWLPYVMLAAQAKVVAKKVVAK
jgi:hypothetical protein